MKSWMLGASLAIVLVAFGTFTTEGAIINSSLQPGVNQLTDVDAESLIKGAGNTEAGVIQIGDTIESVLGFGQLNSSSLASYEGLNYELSALTLLKVTSISTDGLLPNGDQAYNITFAAGFADGTTTTQVYESNGTSSTPGVTHKPDFARDSVSATHVGDPTPLTLAAALGYATDGQLIATFGFGEANDFWTSSGVPLSFSEFKNFALDISGAVFNFGQSLLTNPGNLPILDDGVQSSITGDMYDLIGSGSLYGIKGFTTPFGGFTHTQVEFATTIPEPATACVWLGLACVGIVGRWCGRRRSVRTTS